MEIKGLYREKERELSNYKAIVFESCGCNYFAFYEPEISKIIIIDVNNHINVIDAEYENWGATLRLNGYSHCHIIKYIENRKDIEITIQI